MYLLTTNQEQSSRALQIPDSKKGEALPFFEVERAEGGSNVKWRITATKDGIDVDDFILIPWDWIQEVQRSVL